jgi:hypothetical protein
MALPAISAVQTDITAIYAVLADNKVAAGARYGVQVLSELIAPLNAMYNPTVTLTITDATDADDAALLLVTGEVGLALGRAAVEGDIFAVTGTGDTTDNALAAVGGPIAGSLYQVAAGAATVIYLGNTGTIIETDSESVADFAVVGAGS